MSHLPDMFQYQCSIPRLYLITLPEVGVTPLQLVIYLCRGHYCDTSASVIFKNFLHNFYRECSTPDNPLYIRCDGNTTQLNSRRSNTGRMKAVDGVKNLYKHVRPLKHSDITSARTRNGGLVLSKTVKVFYLISWNIFESLNLLLENMRTECSQWFLKINISCKWVDLMGLYRKMCHLVCTQICGKGGEISKWIQNESLF